MALGAINALANAGISVPGDASVTGFDDILEASYFLPSLTTVNIDFERQGVFIFEALKAAASRQAAPEHTSFMRPQLVVRNSSGVPNRTTISVRRPE
jgi:DNA-binding LacI/PurR family transcriptional regulator